MPDQLTLALGGIGAVFLLMWYGSRALERRREINRLVKGVPAMADSRNPGDNLMADLPAKLDERWLTQRVEENLAVFRETPDLFNQWLITLRDRYRTPWELEILDNAEKKLHKQIRIMKLGAEHAAVRRTMWDQTETHMDNIKTDRLEAGMRYQAAKARSGVSSRTATAGAKNELLEQDAIAAELRARRAKAQKDSRESRRCDGEGSRKPTEDEIIQKVEGEERFRARKRHAATRGRMGEERKWRQELRQKRDDEVAAIRADPALSEEQKELKIEEIEDEYAQVIARGQS